MWFNNNINQKIERRSDWGVENIEWVWKYWQKYVFLGQGREKD